MNDFVLSHVTFNIDKILKDGYLKNKKLTGVEAMGSNDEIFFELISKKMIRTGWGGNVMYFNTKLLEEYQGYFCFEWNSDCCLKINRKDVNNDLIKYQKMFLIYKGNKKLKNPMSGNQIFIKNISGKISINLNKYLIGILNPRITPADPHSIAKYKKVGVSKNEAYSYKDAKNKKDMIKKILKEKNMKAKIIQNISKLLK